MNLCHTFFTRNFDLGFIVYNDQFLSKNYYICASVILLCNPHLKRYHLLSIHCRQDSVLCKIIVTKQICSTNILRLRSRNIDTVYKYIFTSSLGINLANAGMY